jgi:SSS family solute:Na+ symporter
MKFAIIGLYVLVMLAIGIFSMRKNTNAQEFFLGGRTLGPWVSAFAYGTTYFSAVVFIGYAGKTGWSFGMSSLWIVLGNAFVGTMLAWIVLAKPTRRLTARLNVLTMPEFLAARFDSPFLKTVSALIIFLFLVPYSASVYMGLTYLFEVIFQIPFTYALFFIAFLTGLYLVLGGYRAVALADFLQGLVMIAGAILLVFYVVKDPHVGGLAQGLTRLKDFDPKLVRPIGPGFTSLASLVLLTSLGPWGLPQMVQKFYSIKNEKAIKPAIVVSTVFSFVIAFGAYFSGVFGRLFFNNEMPTVGGVPNPDLIMPHIVSIALPEWIGVLILMLILAASMSTLASLVLVSSSAIAMDLVKGSILPALDKKKTVTLMRVLCALFIALSVYIALRPTFIITLMALSWGTIAGSFLAPYLYGLFWRGTTKAGAWAGLITGLGISVVFPVIYRMNSAVIPTIGSVAMLVPLLVVPLVSIFTPAFSEEHLLIVYGTSSNKEYGSESPLRTEKI